MPENRANIVQGYGSVDPIKAPMVLIQSVTPSLGDVQLNQGAGLMYKTMASVAGSGMAVAKDWYLWEKKKEQKAKDLGPKTTEALYMAEMKENIKKNMKALEKQIAAGKAEEAAILKRSQEKKDELDILKGTTTRRDIWLRDIRASAPPTHKGSPEQYTEDGLTLQEKLEMDIKDKELQDKVIADRDKEAEELARRERDKAARIAARNRGAVS